MVTIEVTPLEYRVRGATERLLTSAIEALDPEMLRAASTLEIAENLGAVLRARGYDVGVDVAPLYQLQHRWCGATYTSEEWRAEPHVEREDKRGGVIELRQCRRCRTWVSLVAMRIVTAGN